MDFDVVVVTRNRQPALRFSIPLILRQERLPRRLIVVDSSDDHRQVCAIVEGSMEQSGGDCEVRIIRAHPGMCYQRNAGMEIVTSPVVMFPDDDALWHPGVADSIMRIYERDNEELIGGVGAVESREPPPGLFDDAAAPYRLDFRDTLQFWAERTIDKLEARIFPDPFFLEARHKYRALRVPGWLSEEQAVQVSNIQGFRMSFRTELIRRRRFDENLGRYALFEDCDACQGILWDHCLVDAQRARVCHFRSPERRVDGVEWGAIYILNRAYLVFKHSPPGSLARRRLLRFSYYKLARYLLQAHTDYGRARVRGTWRALSLISQLSDSNPDDLSQRYLAVRRQCLGGG